MTIILSLALRNGRAIETEIDEDTADRIWEALKSRKVPDMRMLSPDTRTWVRGSEIVAAFIGPKKGR